MNFFSTLHPKQFFINCHGCKLPSYRIFSRNKVTLKFIGINNKKVRGSDLDRELSYSYYINDDDDGKEYELNFKSDMGNLFGVFTSDGDSVIRVDVEKKTTLSIVISNLTSKFGANLIIYCFFCRHDCGSVTAETDSCYSDKFYKEFDTFIQSRPWIDENEKMPVSQQEVDTPVSVAAASAEMSVSSPIQKFGSDEDFEEIMKSFLPEPEKGGKKISKNQKDPKKIKKSKKSKKSKRSKKNKSLKIKKDLN